MGKTTCFAIVVFLLAAPAYAQVVPLLNNQGVLRTAGGFPIVDGDYDLAFAFYASVDAQTAVWSETIPDVRVHDGLYSVALGTVTPFPPTLFREHHDLWLGVTVADGGELPRAPLLALAYAFEADHALVATTAENLACTDCVGEDALGFDLCSATASCTPPLQAGAGIQVDGGTISADKDTLAAWAKLACYDDAAELRAALDAVYAPLSHTHEGWEITSPVAEALSSQDSQALEGKALAEVQGAVLNAVAAAGYLKQGDPIGEAQLPPNGLDEVSNGLLTNQFQDVTVAADTPLPIRDFYPPGVSSSILFPDVGTAEELTVSVTLDNTDISGVTVTLVDPEDKTYVLYDRSSVGGSLTATYPDPTSPVDGDLSLWVGKSLLGTWRLTVIDSHFDEKTWPVPDGQLTAWSITTATRSTKKVLVNGDLVVNGTISGPGVNSVLPSGATMAFNLAACPTGWRPADGTNETPDLRGRFPIGVGPLPQGGEVSLAAGGGSHRWRLGVQSGGSLRIGNDSGYARLEWQDEGGEHFPLPETSWSMHYSPYVNHLPPYRALLYCVKN